ncbi:unnamed protein product [Rotaria socialis]|uniref:ATPase AAA-type core domain-containing protein n=2 Tax=Rotaria socialis TaxID=392032 RepID=A0A818PP68_9BILA|nr:unnamed protein product [Rotaria socialis]CAF3412164.1 unnamed protein product [Rotaria socialis]CAF3626510.1 unnamed protein product [Rotaria socialis]CAF4382622.1 unnamed protein product [Rotaria socialis]CAF4474678.1 unnamed protein product [Rotaria socialis]
MSLISNEYVGYFPELSQIVLQKLCANRTQREKIPSVPLFVAHYKTLPCVFKFSHPESNALLHMPSILNYLKNEYGHDLTNDVVLQRYHKKSKQFFAQYRLCNLGNGIIIYFHGVKFMSDIQNPNNYSSDAFDDCFLVISSIAIYYLPEHDIKVQNMVKDLLKYYVFESKFLKLSMICRHQNSAYYLRDIKIKKPMILDLELHYGQNFVKVHEKILNACNKKQGKGIVLLHGIPGSGKTHYIRYLIEEIREKKLIYIPPDMAKHISKPEFLAFLLTHPDSILIIEDAENIICDRNEMTFNASQAVANLLNLSDGLLGDAMHMQIIATFNCDLTIIDKALLRKGRLIADYEFGKLDVDSAQELSNRLGFGMEHISTPMTLAEIYNQNKGNDIEFIV